MTQSGCTFAVSVTILSLNIKRLCLLHYRNILDINIEFESNILVSCAQANRQLLEIDKLNSIINGAEKEMIRIRTNYAHAVLYFLNFQRNNILFISILCFAVVILHLYGS